MIQIEVFKKIHGAKGDMDLDIKLDIKKGSILAITGVSGSGKTTFLKILAGLEKSNSTIKIDDTIWQDSSTFIPPQKRKIGFVFQDYALFPNMSVEENLLFVKKDKDLANYLLEITNLKELKQRFPKNLSGGQKQRVALCRAMMNRPKLLLMDEPLSALDPQMRLKLQNEILLLHKKFKTTTIIISHDPSEIYKLANKVVVFENGKIIKQGSPKDIFLKTSGSQKFSFEGELIDIIEVDVIKIAIVAIGQQIVEVVISNEESLNLQIGQKVILSAKAFSPIIQPIML